MVTISTYEDSSNIIKVELNLEEYNNLDVIINYSIEGNLILLKNS